MTERAAAEETQLVAIGSTSGPAGGRVSLHPWDGTSTIGEAAAALAVDSPTWLQWTADRRRLVVASESGAGRLACLEVTRVGGAPAELRPVADVPTGGSHPCHFAFTGDGSHVVVANYGDGVVSLVEVADGVPVRLVDSVRLHGSGPDRTRQEGSHPHQVAPLGDRTVSVVDLGADRIWSFAVEGGRLHEVATTDLPAGTGPRHLVRSSRPPAGTGASTAYLTGELSGQVLRLAEEEPGRFTVVAAAPASGRPGPNDVAHLALDEERGRLWVSNRGPDTVSTFDVTGGRLELLDEVQVPAHPRQFAVHGDHVLVGGLHGGAVSVHEVRDDGTLGPGRSSPAAGPACVAVAPLRA
jgi:6-phosphogluconolactonase (cycloisomerase 2 family)